MLYFRVEYFFEDVTVTIVAETVPDNKLVVVDKLVIDFEDCESDELHPMHMLNGKIKSFLAEYGLTGSNDALMSYVLDERAVIHKVE